MHWAFWSYLPPRDIQMAVAAMCASESKVAEFCGVTLEFLREAVEYYETKDVSLPHTI